MKGLPSSGEKALSLVGKVLPPAAGALAFFGDPLQNGGGDLGLTFEWMKDRAMNWSFPDIWQLWEDVQNIPVYRNNVIGGGLAAIGIPIAQQFIREIGIPLPDTVNSVLSVLKRTAAGAFAGGTAAALAWLPGMRNPGAASISSKAPGMNPAPRTQWLY